MRRRLNEAAHALEVIGHWDSTFALIHGEQWPSRESAEEHGQQYFRNLPVRYLMYAGEVVSENWEVPETANWPESWDFDTITDVRVYCAYLHQSAVAAGVSEMADIFREKCSYALHANGPSEELPVWIDALQYAVANLSEHLPSDEATRMTEALKTLRAWLG